MDFSSTCTASTIKDAAFALKAGHLVAFPTETVYGLGADATNEKAVTRIYEVKGRPKDHPLIVHISSVKLLNRWARDVPDFALKLAEAFWPGPMTLVLTRTNLAKNFITGGQDNVALRVPSHPVGVELLESFEKLGGLGVAAPSANRFGKVSPTTAIAVKAELNEHLSFLDHILDAGQSQIGVESTIIDCTRALPSILRPGAVSSEMIGKVLKVELDHELSPILEIKAPGMLDSHYSPNAKVILSGNPSPGDGFIAMANIPCPQGAIRLASPEDNDQFARMLYESLRSADHMNLQNVFVVPPGNQGVGRAINDRLRKAAINRL
jgi:L-threonylcarbamoyladenylate synthase